MGDVTVILGAIERGDGQAAEKLIPLVYDELRRLAAARLSHQPPGQTIQATELVHEAYLRLVASEAPGWDGRCHFFRAAAEAMRHILIDRARRKRRPKHGGHLIRSELEGIEIPGALPDEEILALDESLERLVQVAPAAANLVKMRFFAGLTQGQCAEALGVSRRTADNLWAFARPWLYRDLRRDRL
jgi:RNA polymerase sigma factor (TIGR02999 family)